MNGIPGPVGPPGPRGRSGEMGPAVSLKLTQILLLNCLFQAFFVVSVLAWTSTDLNNIQLGVLMRYFLS